MTDPHLSLNELEPDALSGLSAEARAHLDSCPRCRIEARLLAAAMSAQAVVAPPIRVTDALATVSRTLATVAEAADVAMGRYPRIRLLGTGPHGLVFEVRDALDGSRRALKLLRRRELEWAHGMAAVVPRVAQLRHPNVGRIYAWQLEEPPFYWITELVSGLNVLEAARVHSDRSSIAEIFGQVALGVGALHGAGVVHGNLKPQNLLFDTGGRLAIFDAGLVEPDGEQSHYDSPEITRGERPTTASDWYAVGALLREALPAPSGARAPSSETLSRLCAGLLHPDPAQRLRADSVFSALGLAPPDPHAKTHTSGAPPVPPPRGGRDAIERPAALGLYRIEGILARGGMGVVYRGVHEQTGAGVAIKTVPVAQRRLTAGIRREIATLSRIRHPGIIAILDHGLEGDLPWYAMPLVEGTSLTQMAAVHRWWDARRYGAGWPNADLARALAVVRDTCAPLAHLHAAGLIHRDLKPDNILVPDDGRPILVDFGLAWSTGGEVNRETLELYPGLEGTVPYMSPEQIRAESTDARTDLYALGCMLYELTAGRRPFEARIAAEMLHQHLVEVPPRVDELVDGVPAALGELIASLLEKSPDNRPGYADIVGQRLGEILGEASPWAGAVPLPHIYRASLVSREATLRQLDQELGELLSGRGGAIVLLAGESGSGKTRLANEWLRRARERGVDVLLGGGQPHHAGAGGALHPLRPALAAMAERARERGGGAEAVLGSEAALLAPYEPTLAALVGSAATPDDLAPREARLRTLLALTQLLDRWAARRPVVLVLDDVQWADELTLEWLSMMSRARTSRVMVLGLFRSEESNAAIAALRGAPAVRTLALDRLSSAGVSGMVSSMLALNMADGALVSWLFEQSEGNPLFVAEYVRAAVSEGLLARDDHGTWTITGIPGVRGVPQTLGALIHRRIDQLPPSARRLAEWASVLGRELDPEWLDAIAGASPEDMGELLRREVLEETDAGRLRFTHDRLREVTYAGIASAERAAIHRRCAEAQAGEVGRSGWHWEMAGEAALAQDHYLRAASDAWRRGDLEDATRYYRDWLRLAPAVSGEAIEVRTALARVLLDRGHTRDALATAELAQREARDADERLALGRAAMIAAEAQRILGDHAGAHANLLQAGDIFHELGEPAEEARRLSRLATLQSDLGRPREALEILGQALPMQRSLGDRREEGITLNRMAGIHNLLGELNAAATCVEAALAAHRAAGNRHSEAVAEQILALGLQTRGELEASRGLLEHAVARFREVGDRRFEGLTLNALAVGRLLEGDVAEADALFEQAIQIANQVGSAWSRGVSLTHRAAIHERLGEGGRAEQMLDEALAIHHGTGNGLYRYYSWLCLARVRRRRGDWEGCEAAVRAAECAGTLESPFCAALLACERGHLAHAAGRDATLWLAEAERLGQGLEVTPRSELGMAVEALRAAIGT